MNDALDKKGETETGRIGVFPSWGWVYAAVVVYTAALTILLYIFTVTLDLGSQ